MTCNAPCDKRWNRPLKPARRHFYQWLNGLPDWQFTGTLYLLRWAIILPLGLLLSASVNSRPTCFKRAAIRGPT